MSIYLAATAVQSIIYKHLLDRNSDLLASGELALIVQPFGHSVALPSDFVAPAEKPKALDLYFDWSQDSVWMAGTVQSYNASSGSLTFNVNSLSPSSQGAKLGNWTLAIMQTGNPLEPVGTSTTNLTISTGPQSLTVNVGLSAYLSQGVYVYLFNGAVPNPTPLPAEYNNFRERTMEPYYLTEDEHDEKEWWGNYGFYGQGFEPPVNRPSRFRIIGTTMYVKPKPIVEVKITGNYFQRPSPLTSPTQTLPWNELFIQVFKEGVVWILMKSLAMPDTDPAFQAFVKREVDTVIFARFRTLPSRRTRRSNFM
jgi:hypothetical protein